MPEAGCSDTTPCLTRKGRCVAKEKNSEFCEEDTFDCFQNEENQTSVKQRGEYQCQEGYAYAAEENTPATAADPTSALTSCVASNGTCRFELSYDFFCNVISDIEIS